MKTAIRLDDITPDMDWNNYNRIEKILDQAGIKPLIGVVPFNRDDNLSRAEKPLSDAEFVAYLADRKKKDWTFALHGYNHLYSNKKMGIFPLNNFSEYAGVPYDKQLRMLKEGREKLLSWGIDTDIFMTPAHTYDKNTLKALVEAGFAKVTDGFGDSPYIRQGLTFYPISRRRAECTSNAKGYTTMVLHTNTMEDSDIEEFEKMIRERRDCFIDYDEYLKIKAIRRGFLGDLVEYITALAKFILVRIR